MHNFQKTSVTHSIFPAFCRQYSVQGILQIIGTMSLKIFVNKLKVRPLQFRFIIIIHHLIQRYNNGKQVCFYFNQSSNWQQNAANTCEKKRVFKLCIGFLWNCAAVSWEGELVNPAKHCKPPCQVPQSPSYSSRFSDLQAPDNSSLNLQREKLCSRDVPWSWNIYSWINGWHCLRGASSLAVLFLSVCFDVRLEEICLTLERSLGMKGKKREMRSNRGLII